MTGQGGWPMTVFADARRRAVLLRHLLPAGPGRACRRSGRCWRRSPQAWRDQPRRGAGAGRRGRARRSAGQRPRRGRRPVDRTCSTARRRARWPATTTRARGGFGGAPKFPPSMVLEFLLRHHAAHRRRARRWRWSRHTCERDGPRRHLRPARPAASPATRVDAAWVVPHFEKMLYDNALLLRVYTHLWRLTGSTRWPAGSPRETAEFLLRDLRTAEGGFASALDADTEGVEGTDLRLDARRSCARCSARTTAPGRPTCSAVTEAGTFEHGTSRAAAAARDPDDAERLAPACGRRLLAARARRGRSRPATTRWSPPGTGWRSPRWPRPARCSGRAATWSTRLGDARPALLLDAARASTAGCAGSPATACVGAHAGRAGGLRRRGRGVLRAAPVTGDGRLARPRRRRCWTRRSAHFADGDGGFYDTADDAERAGQPARRTRPTTPPRPACPPRPARC